MLGLQYPLAKDVPVMGKNEIVFDLYPAQS